MWHVWCGMLKVIDTYSIIDIINMRCTAVEGRRTPSAPTF